MGRGGAHATAGRIELQIRRLDSAGQPFESRIPRPLSYCFPICNTVRWCGRVSVDVATGAVWPAQGPRSEGHRTLRVRLPPHAPPTPASVYDPDTDPVSGFCSPLSGGAGRLGSVCCRRDHHDSALRGRMPACCSVVAASPTRGYRRGSISLCGALCDCDTFVPRPRPCVCTPRNTTRLSLCSRTAMVLH